MEVPGQLPGNSVEEDWGHSDMTVGLVLTRLDVSASRSITVIGCVLVSMDVSVEPFFASCVDQM